MFRQLLQRLPSRCFVCHAWPAQAVCEHCVHAFAQPQPRCTTCARVILAGMQRCGSCIVQPPPLDACHAAVAYAYPWSSLLLQFKFQQHTAWAGFFALLLRSTPWVEPALEQADWLIPMPLSKQRLQERGFNQALLLSQALQPHKTQPKLLLRIIDTPAQSTLPRKQRLTSLKNAFMLEPSQTHAIQGKRIVLIDDVMTTGATLHAAARVLKAAGAVHVTGLVFARTE